jgi:DNA polymerase I
VSYFKQIVACDFEYEAPGGARPYPIAMAAEELLGGRRRWQLFEGGFGPLPPFDIGPETLFVSYNAAAELGCFLALGWPMAARGIDCLVEYRALINETRPKLPNGQTAPAPPAGFEHALAAYELSHGSAAIKGEIAADIGNARWRGKWSPAAIIKYVTDDTHHLAELFEAMLCGRTQRFVDGAVRRRLKPMDTLRAQYRYRYSGPATARMQWAALPVDVANWSTIGRQRKGLTEAVIRKYDPTLKLDAAGNIISGLYWDDAAKGRWTWGKHGNNQFARFLIEHDIPWPRLPSGALEMKDENAFKHHPNPQIQMIHRLRGTMSVLQATNIAIGPDHRHRCSMLTFKTGTSRNAPLGSIFGGAVWVRSALMAPPDHSLIAIDWANQEIAIVAILSGDPELIRAYATGDIYHAFGLAAGVVKETDRFVWRANPEGAAQRQMLKSAVLAINYGMAAPALAFKLGIPLHEAVSLLRTHHQTYRRFWQWLNQYIDTALIRGEMRSVMGWPQRIVAVNRRAIANFPAQSNGAELMRLAACVATEEGIEVCMPVHDQFIALAHSTEAQAVVDRLARIMVEAGTTLFGNTLTFRSDYKIIPHGERYKDNRDLETWPFAIKEARRLENGK